MTEFSDQPYLCYQYPGIEKHYPGTWRVVGRNGKELKEIVCRLTQPTRATKSRADDIREHTAIFRLTADREKAKDVVFRALSAGPKLEKVGRRSTGSSRQTSASGSGFRRGGKNAGSGSVQRRKCEETSWAVVDENAVSSESAASLPQL
ncbi:uncharacterized protein LOC143276183 isoform X2 [Babylonia areolata]